MRIFLLLVFLNCSGLILGQEVKLSFRTGGMSILDFKEIKERGLEIVSYGHYWYELVGEKLFKHDVKRIEDPKVITLTSNVYETSDIPRTINTSWLIAKKIKYYIDSVQVTSVKDTVEEFSIAPWHKGNFILSFIESNAAMLKIEHAILEAEFIRSEFDSLVISDVEFINEVKIENTMLPKYIRVDRTTCKDEKFKVDFTRFLIGDSTGICDLELGKGAAGLIKANYKYYNLVFDKYSTVYDKEQIYVELLNSQRNNYFPDGYEKLDKEYKAFQYLNKNTFFSGIQNWIDKHWWDYGYDKFLVIRNSFVLFMLFFVINLFAYRKLIEVYHPEKFKLFDDELDNRYHEFKNPKKVKKEWRMARTMTVFLYTAFLFWGLKLDLKELEIKKPLYMTILIGQYITGLVCLAYIANYIISK